MRDPHVNSIWYRLETGKNISYINPPPVKEETAEFVAELKEGFLIFDFKQHYSSVESAKAAVADFIRTWEIHVALTKGRGQFNLIYENAEIIDRNPPPPSETIQIEVANSVIFADVVAADVHYTQKGYPDPPRVFRLTPDVETLWYRFEGYLRGEELLQSMAYFCLTLIENIPVKGRKAAATYYNIDLEILRKLGELSSNRGDLKSARKIEKGSSLIPLSPQECTWIEAAIKALIIRIGEYKSGFPLPKLKMTDLPKL